MLEAWNHYEFFWVDDYFFTGVLVGAANGTHKQLNSMYLLKHRLVAQKFFDLKPMFAHLSHKFGYLDLFYWLWDKVKNENKYN